MPESIAGQKVIERLYQGNRWDVYRVQMPSGDTAIAKVSCEEFPSAEALVRLRAEYDTLTRLRDVAGVVQVLGLERDRQGLALMLADGGGLPLSKILAAERLSLRDALVVGIQTAAILSRIHSQTLIHKDINPSNILWNRDTGTVEIIDFELATTHASERQVVISPTSLDGTLAYMAPEQTGRMNRSIDYRSDLYALGVSLYQIFTGGLPFVTRDAMELVHSHLAKLPDSPTDRDATIPKVISEIVLRLMAKTAEERYQSALGVQRDLEQALAQLDQTGSIASFALGTKDRPHGLRVSQTLYGREAEVKLLVNSVETAGSGPAELIMVGGYSGVGKTALLEELHKPVAQRRGYFISGKFDQFQRHIPHTAIIQAFRALVSQLLTEPETDVLLWGEALTSALGELGQVLVDLIPEFEIILGPQPPIVALDGADAEARLHTVIASLLDALCTAEHPMALFLDDLQWADPASLKLLRHLATETKHRHLVLLGAYRDNEVSPEHPLMLTLAAIAEQRPYRALELEPLSADWTNALVADSLDAAPEITQPLADAVYAKTLGNPFFVSRLLQSIYENGLLVWDVERRGWSWDLPAIQSLAFSDNVVDLMVAKINQLPDLTRSLLQQASCLGASFALDALTDICDVARSMTAASLDFAVQADLLRLEGASGRLRSWPVGQDKAEEEDATSSPSGVTLFFVHDRIQEAAYSQLSVAQRQAIHWRAGVTLLRSLSEPERLKALFPLVNHLNQGWSEGADGPTAVDLAELNLEAGLRAMASVAHATALDYIRQGIAYLGPVGWDSHHHLMFDLHRALAKAEFQCGHHDATEAVIAELNSRAIGRTQKASLHAFMLEVSLTRGRWADGLAVGLECLTLFGFDLPQEEAALDAALAAEQAAIDALLAGRDIAALADAPLMQDPDKIQVLELLHRTWTCAYMVNYKLGTLAVLKVVRLSLDHGNAPFSAFGYIVYGSILSSVHNEYQKAYEFGLLALNLNERFGVVELVPKVNNMFAHTINHFAKPLASNIPIYEESYQASLACGDLWWGVWAVDFLVGNQFIKGDALDKVHETSLRYQGYVEKSGDAALLHMMRLNQHVVLNLRGLTPDAISLTGPDWDVDKALAELRALPFDFGVFWIRLSQSILHLLYGDLERATAASAEAEALKANAP
ncbi:MAG: ATP-binding protein, partial [Rhodospirillaceae bacterium]